MVRACFFALGLWTLLTGLALSLVERSTLRLSGEWEADLPFTRADGGELLLEPPLWVPFAATSLGVVVTLYAAALPWRTTEA